MYSKPKCSSFDELNSLIDKVKDKAGKEFESLVSSLSINKSKNKEWATAFYSLTRETEKLSKSIRRLKVWKWILLIPLIFPFFLMNSSQKKKQPILEQKTKELEVARNNLQKQLGQFKTLLTYDFAYNKIISQAWPDVQLDLYMDEQTANWEYDYSQYMPVDSCATTLLSGQMFEHPFVLMNRFDQTWYPHVYTGSVAVPYTVTIDGKTETRTEIVTATVTLPAPAWNATPYFLYRTSKPESLTFCNDISSKTLKKQTKKGNMQSMDNPEFDKIFAASRNNEIEYRTVFTPYAQEGFVQLFKHAQYKIEKEKEVTSIYTACGLIDNDFSDDVNYDLDEWKNKYCDWIGRLVKHIGLFSLPIANMPIYYQMSYKGHTKQTASRLQAQANAAWICDTYQLYNAFETNTIFECTSYRTLTANKQDVVCNEISCNYFHPNHRVQTVPMPSRRGMVLVPVHVIDYLPRDKSLYIYSVTGPQYKDIELIGDSYSIHSGQLLIWSWHPISDALLRKQIEKITK